MVVLAYDGYGQRSGVWWKGWRSVWEISDEKAWRKMSLSFFCFCSRAAVFFFFSLVWDFFEIRVSDEIPQLLTAPHATCHRARADNYDVIMSLRAAMGKRKGLRDRQRQTERERECVRARTERPPVDWANAEDAEDASGHLLSPPEPALAYGH